MEHLVFLFRQPKPKVKKKFKFPFYGMSDKNLKIESL